MSNLDKFKEALKNLVKHGDAMIIDLELRDIKEQRKLSKKEDDLYKKVEGRFERKFQKWYTESLEVIKQLIPERLQEFIILYNREGKRKTVDSTNYCIQDWLNGIRSGTNYLGEKLFNDFAIVAMRFKTQLEILKSAELRFDSILLDIKQILQADLFDNELDAAKELLKNGFLRAAGTLAGVILEAHLSQVCDNHSIRIKKKTKNISDYNDNLKNNDVYDIAQWRF